MSLAPRFRYASILAFDVNVTHEGGIVAKELNVKVFTADIIYHLFDKFTAYMADVRKEQQVGPAPQPAAYASRLAPRNPQPAACALQLAACALQLAACALRLRRAWPHDT